MAEWLKREIPQRIISRAITELCALGSSTPPQGLRILMYHAVGTALDFDDLGLSIDPLLFREHMELLKADRNFNPVPLDFRALSNPHRPVAVTFDDGYQDNLTTAAPILAEFELPFTVFVVPAYIQSGHPYYLTTARLKELAAIPGCTIGSHGMHHKHLAELPPAEAEAELADSRKWLEDTLGRPILSLSYPYGSANLKVRKAAFKAGYTLASCSRTSINDYHRDPLMLCRTEILAFDGPRQFRQKLYGAWDWHRFRHKDPARA